MVTASWNGRVLAESDACEKVEGNFYFPRSAVDPTVLQPSATHTTCAWKGMASYYNVVVDGKVNTDAAWYYPDPRPAAQSVKDRIAFWRGVTVRET